MKTAGIICEYNPFHLGHQRQLRWLKEERGIDNVVLAMSGNFVQRGQRAVTDKETRTRMALACGADLVLELPALFALRGAYWFALGGVSLLGATGVVDYLAFGAETDDLASLQATARRLAFPDPEYQLALKRYLDAGLPYAEPRPRPFATVTAAGSPLPCQTISWRWPICRSSPSAAWSSNPSPCAGRAAATSARS